jgi:hypothetical protein
MATKHQSPCDGYHPALDGNAQAVIDQWDEALASADAMAWDPVIERVNEFTGLTSYFCGDAAMTADHNHEPFGGNWKYVVGKRGHASRVFVGEQAFSEAMAHLVAIGRATPVAPGIDWRSRSFAEVRASLPAGETLCERLPDGTVVLRRADLSVGSYPGAVYVIDNGNAALNVRRYAPSLADRLEEAA